MADLDDFFAKKNKKKSKPKKFVPEEMAQKLEEAEKKQQEKDRRQEQKREELMREEHRLQMDGADGSDSKAKPVEEWQEVDEQSVDLSDLNIRDLQQPEQPVRPGADPSAADGSQPTGDATGPWNRGADKRSAADEDDAEPVVEAPKPAAAPAPAPAPASSVYVPPSRRGGGGAAEETGGALAPVRLGGMRSWRSEKVPDVASAADFPSLGAAVETPTKSAWSQKPGRMPVEPFRQVRGSGGSSQDRIAQPNRLQLGNQFDALRTNDAY